MDADYLFPQMLMIAFNIFIKTKQIQLRILIWASHHSPIFHFLSKILTNKLLP